MCNPKCQNLCPGHRVFHVAGMECFIISSWQVLILDEPTASLDLSSRYHVWSLLKEHKANRVTLFSTQLTDEADIIAGEHGFLIPREMMMIIVTQMSFCWPEIFQWNIVLSANAEWLKGKCIAEVCQF